jgi:hypothetical protein
VDACSGSRYFRRMQFFLLDCIEDLPAIHCTRILLVLTLKSSKIKLYIFNIYVYLLSKGFAKGSPHSVLLLFSQSYVEHDLRKNKIIASFFCQQINFYELIVRF